PPPGRAGSPNPGGAVKPVKVLVVDDEPDVQWLFEQRFRREIRTGLVNFHFSFSGEEALPYLHSGGAADVLLVLSDSYMRGMPGLELPRVSRGDYPPIAVCMSTDGGDDEAYATAIASGARAYHTKPIGFDALNAKIARRL